MTDGAHNGHFIHDLGKIGHLIAKMHPGHTRLHAAKLTPDFLGSIGLGVKTLIMGWATILPYQDAVQGLGRLVLVGLTRT